MLSTLLASPDKVDSLLIAELNSWVWLVYMSRAVLQLSNGAACMLRYVPLLAYQAKEWQNFSSWMAEQELGPEYGEELLALLAEVVSWHKNITGSVIAACLY